MKQYLLFLTVLLFFTQTIIAQVSPKRKLAEFKFDFIMGHTQTDPGNTYSILGMSFMQPIASDNARKMLSDWLTKHPSADVIPVCAFGVPDSVPNGSKDLFIFVWIVDKKDTLNNYLIKNGCFVGGEMFGYDEWEKTNKNAPPGTHLPKIVVYVNEKDYQVYKDQIVNSEYYANNHKLGLWSAKEYNKIKDLVEKSK